MCRFFLIKSNRKISIEKWGRLFAYECKRSKEWQGDGWGIAWLNESGEWEIQKSTNPIWEEIKKMKSLPPSLIFVIHARSSSYEKDKNNIEFNQPFLEDKIAFVFNGFIKGVKLNVPGMIGSEKIFYIFKNYLKNHPIPEALLRVKEKIYKSAREIVALNVGICDKENVYAFCNFSTDDEYYTIHYICGKELKIISSMPVGSVKFKTMKSGEILIA